MSAFDTLLDAFVSTLNTPTPVCAHIETDGDTDPLPAGRTASIIVELGGSQSTQLGGLSGNPVDWATQIHVKCFASATAASARPAANALASAAYSRLSADPGLGLGASVFIGEPQIAWDAAQVANRICCASLTYTVSHRTTGGTLN